MTYEEVSEAYLQSIKIRGFSKETCRGYMRDLKQFEVFIIEHFNGSVYIDEISMNDVEKYMHYLTEERKLKPRSRNRYLSSLNSMFTYALKNEWVEKNPAALIDAAKVIEQQKDSLSEEEIDQLLKAVEKPILRMAILLMAKTGMRINEVVELKTSAVDLELDVIHVIEAKGGKYRKLPLAKSLKPEIIEYLETVRKSDSEYFFATTKTGRLSAQYVNLTIKKTGKLIGIEKKVTNHTLRRSFATNLLKRDVNIVVIQKLLGHASLRTTSIYLNVMTVDLRNAVDLLE
ncbi:tyrosine-type recombinase/integrase [Sporosarcina jeotgali]|uniref:Tyrosine-type recombinase/integrase n=1 Tax=Sporosarcina jeotgali TaxID=3020056 RepID=A0ABZ0KWG2_9BACL|nr:tyrosine-type recombinase/integrase [Sporosarcina sp. B2O-1]WOV84726.1 tyrosine-type recombinase/integrase [Sporosarcina sp. B2O-1]